MNQSDSIFITATIFLHPVPNFVFLNLGINVYILQISNVYENDYYSQWTLF